VIEFGLLRPETSFDSAQTPPISELSEGQTEELVPTREAFDITIALVAVDTKLKLIGWDEVEQLRKNGSAKIHQLSPEKGGKQPNHAKNRERN
jgi:hypothetical protein